MVTLLLKNVRDPAVRVAAVVLVPGSIVPVGLMI